MKIYLWLKQSSLLIELNLSLFIDIHLAIIITILIVPDLNDLLNLLFCPIRHVIEGQLLLSICLIDLNKLQIAKEYLFPHPVLFNRCITPSVFRYELLKLLILILNLLLEWLVRVIVNQHTSQNQYGNECACY